MSCKLIIHKILVITNEHNMRIFEVNFAHKKMLDEFYSDMMNWCEKSLKEFQYVNASRFTRKVDEKVYHNKSFESLELMEPETFNDENFIATVSIYVGMHYNFKFIF